MSRTGLLLRQPRFMQTDLMRCDLPMMMMVTVTLQVKLTRSLLYGLVAVDVVPVNSRQ